MSDITRQGSPRIAMSSSISSSPSRPSPLSRPHWPYSTYTHRPASSSSSLSGSSVVAALGWDARSSGAGTPGFGRRSSHLPPSLAQDDNTRHWSFTAFEWIVKDISRLRDYVEGTERDGSVTDPNSFEIFKDSPLLADGKFKLEIAKPPPPEQSDAESPVIRTQPPSLSLYVASVMLEYAHADYEICSSMFAGIKCQEDRGGERGARADWVWEYWQNDWVYREDSEVWECPLPPLSTLLENPRIRKTDSFVLCIQIHSPIGPFFPHQPSAAYVPKDLLDGLEALLDNANTGDVQFVCLERKEEEDVEGEESLESPNTETPRSRRSSSSSSSAATPPTLARKRVIYAHSDILIRRSEYFATMLNSSFAETTLPSGPSSERKTYTIVVEEADFATIYWLLKWVYANWLLFKEIDNPKVAIEGVGAGWSVKSLNWLNQDEWAWQTLNKSPVDLLDIADSRSVASAGSGGNKGQGPTNQPKSPTPMRSSSSSKLSPSPKPSSASTARTPSSPARRTTSTGASTSNTGVNLSVPGGAPAPTSPRSNKSPLPPISTSGTFPPGAPPHFPLSPHTPRKPGRSRPPGSQADPHPHPTQPPPPASALAMYAVAHRYGMPGLSALSLEHIMATIMPERSFALLLASATWDEVHALVEDFVVDKWDEVSVSAEFEQCCQEVAAGEWGSEGGKTLTALFRRLRSPGVSR